MGTLRKIIFFVFVAIYLVAAPLTVLYALGFIFSPVQYTLLQTGLVSLDTEPVGAKVWLNGAPIKGTTPLILRNLEPGPYEILVRKPGSHSWRKNVQVRADLALRYENILLFPLKTRPEILGDAPIRKMWYTPQARRFLILQADSAAGLFSFELDGEKFHRVLSTPNDLRTHVNEAFLHPSGDLALVTLQNAGRPESLLIKFADPIQINRLTDFIQPPFRQLQWGKSQKRPFFYLKEDTLRRLDSNQEILYFDLGRRVRGYTLRGRRVFIMDRKRRFLELTEKGRVHTILLDESAKINLVFGPDRGEHYTISFLPSSSLFLSLEDAYAIFLSDRGRLFSNKLPYLLDEGVEELAIAQSHPRLLYRKGTALWIVDFEVEKEKTFFEAGLSPRKIYEGSEPIANLLWFYDDRYILFIEGNRVRVKDVEEDLEAMTLFEISNRLPQLILDEGQGYAYFAHPENHRLARVKLFEARGILPRFVEELVGGDKESE